MIIARFLLVLKNESWSSCNDLSLPVYFTTSFASTYLLSNLNRSIVAFISRELNVFCFKHPLQSSNLTVLPDFTLLCFVPHDDHLVLGHHGLGLNPLDRLEAHRTDDSKSYNKGPENGYVPSNRHNRCYNG